jgi:hypothetical protein
MALPTYGTMAVDWENRIDFDRLRRERLARAKDLLAEVGDGRAALLRHEQCALPDGDAHRHMGAGQGSRFTLLPQNDEPILWDFGSAAKHHQLHCPWLGERSRPGISDAARRDVAGDGPRRRCGQENRIELEMRGLHKEPVGIDIIELPVLFALQKEGITVVDGQQLMSEARVIKTRTRFRCSTRPP